MSHVVIAFDAAAAMLPCTMWFSSRELYSVLGSGPCMCQQNLSSSNSHIHMDLLNLRRLASIVQLLRVQAHCNMYIQLQQQQQQQQQQHELVSTCFEGVSLSCYLGRHLSFNLPHLLHGFLCQLDVEGAAMQLLMQLCRLLLHVQNRDRFSNIAIVVILILL